LIRNDGAAPTANLQLISIRIFEKERIIATAVFRPDLWTLDIFAPGLTHNFRDLIDFFRRIRPKCDSCLIRVMMGILSESEKFCWFFCNTSLEGAPVRATPIPGKTKRGQHLREKLLCSCAIPHPQINVIEQ